MTNFQGIFLLKSSSASNIFFSVTAAFASTHYIHITFSLVSWYPSSGWLDTSYIIDELGFDEKTYFCIILGYVDGTPSSTFVDFHWGKYEMYSLIYIEKLLYFVPIHFNK